SVGEDFCHRLFVCVARRLAILHEPESITRSTLVPCCLPADGGRPICELPAFPLDALNPEWLRDWVKRAAHGTGTSVDHVAVPLLGISSSLIGTRRRVQPARSWSEPMTLWCGVVGFSGTGKTPGIDATRKALDDIEYEREDDIAELHREHAERVE